MTVILKSPMFIRSTFQRTFCNVTVSMMTVPLFFLTALVTLLSPRA